MRAFLWCHPHSITATFILIVTFIQAYDVAEYLKFQLCLPSVFSGLCAASELLRVDVLQTAINYR